jgi:hypothetical protein
MIRILLKKNFATSRAIHTPICVIGGGNAGINVVS